MFRRGLRLSTTGGISLLVAVSLGVLVWSFTSGFRLNSDEISLAWQANSTRLMILFAAGFSQCAGFAALKTSVSLRQHIRFYLCLVSGCAALIAASIMSLQFWLMALLVVTAIGFTFYLSRKLNTQTSLGRLILGVVLYGVFFLSIAVYFAASTQGDGIYGGFVLWLFSSPDISNHSAIWAVLSIFGLIASLMLVKQNDLLAISAIGIAIGLVGPLIFVSYFALLVLPAHLGLRSKILTAGLLGGTFLVATSSAVQLMFGGYVPALIIPLAFVFIPFVLLFSGCQSKVSKQVTLNQTNRIFERILLAIIALISLAVVLHVNRYAQGLI